MNFLEIEGKFGLELFNLQGKKIKNIVSKNTVVNQGVRQIKRWLDRPEYITPNASPANWKDVIYCAGEVRRIVVRPKLTWDGNWQEYVGFYPDKMFDMHELTYSHHWQNYNNSEYLYLYLDEPIDLKQIGLITDFKKDHWAGWGDNTVAVQLLGFTVTNAGDTDYNSNDYYIMPETTYNGHYVFKRLGQDKYIFVNDTKTEWHMSDSIGGSAVYKTNDSSLPTLPSDGNWILGSGSNPPPDVTKGTGKWLKAFLMQSSKEVQEGERRVNYFHFEPDSHNRDDIEADNYIGRRCYTTVSFEGIEEFKSEFNWYGFIPFVTGIRFRTYTSWDHTDGDVRIYELHLYEANMHPQNPCTLKLGLDDGSILPLAKTNISLGNLANGMEWKVDSITQENYKVRFTKRLGAEEANNLTFKEIGLFGNLDGHLVTKRRYPKLEYDDMLFARSIFDTPWLKTENQTAVIYYEIEIKSGSSSSSSSSSSSLMSSSSSSSSS